MSKWWIAGLLAITACVKQTPIQTKEACRRPCSLLYTVRLDPNFSESEKKEVWEGMQVWTRATEGMVCFIPQLQDSGYNLVVIRGETKEALKPYLDKWDGAAAIHKDNTIVIAMDASKPNIVGIMAHEAGHHLGLMHTHHPKSIMRSDTGALIDGELPEYDRDTFYHRKCF